MPRCYRTERVFVALDPFSLMVCLAGPNGAGKSTVAPSLVRDALKINTFLNADTIAAGLSAFHPEKVAVTAGKILLRQFDGLTQAGDDFAFETTLASRLFAPRIRALTHRYEFRLIYLWLPDADAAVARVASRVQGGGHHIPEEVIRRRYYSGIRNFFSLYRPLSHTWQVYDNIGVARVLVASGERDQVQRVYDETRWKAFERSGKS
jgi:predicted ABC-type ATPase